MKQLLVCLATILLSAGAMAGPKPFNLSLVPNVAIYDRTETIDGVTLSIWGENQQHSLALGIVNGSVGQSAGFSWAFVLNYAEDYRGVQWGLVNFNTGDFTGWQDGFVNYTGGHMTGFQLGAVNYAGKLTGLQLGFVNYAATAESGLQIGFVNILPENDRWFSELPSHLAPAMIIVNWRF